MDSPENKIFDKTSEAVFTSTKPKNPVTLTAESLNNNFISSSVPDTRSHSFITDSSDKSDDSSSIFTSSNSYYNEFAGDGNSEDSNEENENFSLKKSTKNQKQISEPIIYTSSLTSSNSSNSSLISVSPTSVYATMLSANNIVSNSINVMQTGTRLPNPPTLIEFSDLRFLIMDAPSQSNLHLYLKEIERLGVKNIVRVCEPTYSKEIVESHGIKVHDWVFPDGESPPSNIIEAWMNLVDNQKSKFVDGTSSSVGGAIAVHCVAGLGRAPVLVAIALIENGMRPLDAVMFIRQRRRGAINNKQLKFLENYRPRHLKKDKCIIM